MSGVNPGTVRRAFLAVQQLYRMGFEGVPFESVLEANGSWKLLVCGMAAASEQLAQLSPRQTAEHWLRQIRASADAAALRQPADVTRLVHAWHFDRVVAQTAPLGSFMLLSDGRLVAFGGDDGKQPLSDIPSFAEVCAWPSAHNGAVHPFLLGASAAAAKGAVVPPFERLGAERKWDEFLSAVKRAPNVVSPESTSGFAPLHVAAAANASAKVVQKLLEFGADPLQRCIEGLPVEIAKKHNSTSALSVLEKATVDVPPLNVGAQQSQQHIQQPFVHPQPQLPAQTRSPIQQPYVQPQPSVQPQKPAQTRPPIQQPYVQPQPQQQPQQPVQQPVQPLRQTLADPTMLASSKRSQLHEACLAGNITAVRGLVAQHPEQLEMPAAEGETPLYFASMRGHSAIVDLLLKSGASVNSQTRSGNTPLHAAARGGHAEVLKSLLSARANPGAMNAFGETAFFVACVQGHTEIASTLSRAGPGAGVPNKANMTPLHIASLCGHKEIVGMLLSMGTPDVNSPDGFNRTPLFLAGAGTHQEVSDAVARAGGKETGQIAPAPAPANPPQPSGSAQPLPWASGAAASASTHAAPAPANPSQPSGSAQPLPWASGVAASASTHAALAPAPANPPQPSGSAQPLPWASGAAASASTHAALAPAPANPSQPSGSAQPLPWASGVAASASTHAAPAPANPPQPSGSVQPLPWASGSFASTHVHAPAPEKPPQHSPWAPQPHATHSQAPAAQHSQPVQQPSSTGGALSSTAHKPHAIPTTAPFAPAEQRQHGAAPGKFATHPEESFVFRGVLGLPPTYTPERGCKEAVLSYTFLKERVPNLETIVQECEMMLGSISNDPKTRDLLVRTQMTPDEAFAILLATYDDIYEEPEQNFFLNVNSIIRRRAANETRQLLEFLFFLLSGMRKLPAWQGEAFTSYPDRARISTEYVKGREIWWSTFHRATCNPQAAIETAGSQGVLIKLNVVSARDITPFVLHRLEGGGSEIMIPPNMCLVVSEPPHSEPSAPLPVAVVSEKPSPKSVW